MPWARSSSPGFGNRFLQASEACTPVAEWRDPCLRLTALDVPGCFYANPDPALFTGWPDHQFVLGGMAVAGCIAALEATLDRPTAFASAQFLTHATPGQTLRFEVATITRGNSLSTAVVSGFADEQLFISLQGTAGQRSPVRDWQGAAAPDVQHAQGCRPVSVARLLSSNINALFELRIAAGSLPDRAHWRGPGHEPLCFWARARNGRIVDRPVLAILADFLAIGLPGAFGEPASGTSLDNHIRFIGCPQTEWVLCAIEIEAAHNGLVHGRMRLFSACGQLMAIASQTMVLR